MAATAVALLLSLSATAARADSPTSAAAPSADDPTLRPLVAQRRKGVVLGAAGGIAFAGASGYPNNEQQIDNPAFYSSSPLLVGYSMSYFLLGALTDYFSFGPALTIATFESSKWKSVGWGLGFRAEVFPLVKLVPALADTALYGSLGVGTTELRAKGPYPSAGGTQSMVGVGVHHEWRIGTFLGGHGAIGPQLEYDVISSRANERHWFWAGLRIVWYGGSVTLDKKTAGAPSLSTL